MRLQCSSCHQPVRAEDVNVDRMVAKCRGCHAVFDFSDQLADQSEQQKERPLKIARSQVPLPEGLSVQWGEAGGFGGLPFRSSQGERRAVTIVRRWFQASKHLPMLLFALVWNAFMVFWYSAAVAGDGPWIMFLFPVVHVAVGVGMGYGALTGIFNRTTIEVADDKLRVRHGPLPWPGNLEMPAGQLEQLYCTQNEHRTKNGVNFSHDLKAAVQGGRSVTLIKKIPEAEQALYIEQALEAALQIVDVAMPGETKARVA